MHPQPLPPGSTETVAVASALVLAPHFDDEVLGCGGLLARIAASGGAARALFLTDGSGGVERVGDRESYSRRRREEAVAAAEVLGLSGIEVLEIPDGELEHRRGEAAGAIRRALLSQRPRLVLAPSPSEATPDHRAAFAALHDALTEARPGEALNAVLGSLEVWLYEVNHPGYPDVLVDVSEQLPTLERAMAAYASQEERHPYLRSALGLRRYRTHSLDPGVEAAEGYRRLRGEDFATQGLITLARRVGATIEPIAVDAGPTISVIVRTRDRPRLLAEALASLSASSYRRLQVVLVNDGGVPPQVPPDLGLDLVRVELPDNRGRAEAANAGIAAATGAFVGFLDDDDLVEPEHFQLLAGLARGSGARVVYSDAAVGLYEPDAREGWSEVGRRLPYSRDFDPELLLLDNYIPFNTVLIDRALLAEVGTLDPELPFFEDWDLLIRLAERAPFLHLKRVTCEYRHFRGGADHVLGEHGRAREDFLAMKARVLGKHRQRLAPDRLARAVDRLRGEAVTGEERRRQLVAVEREIAELRHVLAGRDEQLRRTYAEIERLGALIARMEGTRAWRLHRWVERVRGR